MLFSGISRGEGLTRFETGPCQGSSGAVRVDQLSLVFSTQLIPVLESGLPVAGVARDILREVQLLTKASDPRATYARLPFVLRIH